MTVTSRYLSTLSKIMRNLDTSSSQTNEEKYDRLYSLIHSELNGKLQESLYPYTSDIIQKTEVMLNTMEPLFLFPEIVGKKCVLISNHITTSVFYTCKTLFDDKKIASIIGKMNTQIPLIIIHTDENETIEVLNYANIRSQLSVNELEFLIGESGRRKIALNKIVQFIIVKTKLKDPQLCVIADNIYGNAGKVLWRTISKKIVYIDNEGAKIISRRQLYKNSVLLMSDEVFNSIAGNPAIKKYRRISFSDIREYVKNEVKPVLYGFWEEFISVETQILDYYDKQLLETGNMLKDVVGDVVRVGKGDRTLNAIRSFEENKKKKLEAESKAIQNSLKEIEKLVMEICIEFEENISKDKVVSRYTIDDIFEAFFRCKNYNDGLGKKLIARLYSYDYDNQGLVLTYVQSMTGTKKEFEAIEIDSFEWEKAKMLIGILDVDRIPVECLQSYVKILGKRCCTGKELYAKSLIFSGIQKKELLLESLEKGYRSAASILIKMYEEGDHHINLQSLANALVPEACMILANQSQSDNFTYYKIAAASEYLPAIDKIVDIVYESEPSFSSGYQIPKKEVNTSKYEKMVHDGHVIRQLCNVLIDKMYRVEKNSEILGIILFCLNENLSESMRLLSKANSAIAYYCKGNMYEFGGGVSIDLEEAVMNYEYAMEKNSEGKLTDRIYNRWEKCLDKIEKYENDADDYYKADQSYSSSRSSYTSSSSDGCFAPATKILMADGTHRAVENIKVNDLVLVFDHYTGTLCEEKIIANVHDFSGKKVFQVIEMLFENGSKLKIVKSHVLFDVCDNQYVWIDSDNVKDYVGHAFAFWDNRKIVSNKLVDYSIEWKNTNYYMPISRFHMNVFAENILTMPPTKITTNIFPVNKDMVYDLTVLNQTGTTPYDEIVKLVSREEYENLPCKYLTAILTANHCTIDDLKNALRLYREQRKYLDAGDCLC